MNIEDIDIKKVEKDNVVIIKLRYKDLSNDELKEVKDKLHSIFPNNNVLIIDDMVDVEIVKKL